MLKMILKEIQREKREETRRKEREEKARKNWITQINKNAVQPAVKNNQTDEQIEKILNLFRKVKVI